MTQPCGMTHKLEKQRLIYVDLGFSKRDALCEFFSDQFMDKLTSGLNGDRNCQLTVRISSPVQIPNIDNTIVLNLIILTLVGNEE